MLRLALPILTGGGFLVAVLALWQRAPYAATGVATTFYFGAVWLLLRAGRERLASVLAVLGLLAVPTYSLAIGLGVHDLALIIFPPVMVLGSLVLERRERLALAVLTVAVTTALGWADRAGWIGGIAPRARLDEVLLLPLLVTTIAIFNELLVAAVRDALASTRASERNYREVFNAAREAILVLDAASGEILDLNETALEMFSVTRDRAVGSTVATLAGGGEELPAGPWRELVRREAEEGPHLVEWQARRADGTRFWAEVSLRSSAIGGQGRVLAVIRDVSERRRAQEAHAESERLVRAAFETSPDAILITRLSDGVCLAVNESFTRITGYAREELLGRTTADLPIWVQPEDRRRVMDSLGPGGLSPNLEADFRHKDGRILRGLIAGRVIEVGGVPCLLGVTRDVTAWKEAAEERDRLAEQLRHSQKMEAMGLLAGGAAHDFNNLLTAILTCGHYLQEELGPAHPAREDADQIVAAAERAAGLTRQLLALGRRQVLAPRLLSLGELVRGMEQMLHRTLGEAVRLEVEVRAPGTVEADPAQLELVVLNLAVNARDAMPDGGTLTLAVDELGEGADQRPAAAEVPPGPLAVLRVRDTGVGMPPEVQARIFEPFFTTKAPGKGSGLGLSMAYGIVTQSGGTFRVRSTPGRGTELAIYLPLRGAPLPAAAPGPERSRAAGGRETVLLVEDDRSVRAVARRTLTGAGYQVLEAAHPDAALAQALGRKDGIDLLLTDVLLPDRNGWELSRAVAGHRPGIRVLFMSGYAGNRLDGTPLLPPEAPLLHKPFSPEELLAAVRAALSAVR